MFSYDKIYRVIDVNLNRAAEGLRVLEDVVRFCMDHEDLTRKLKNLRHLLVKEAHDLPGKEKLIISRSSLQDVGSELKETSRKKIEELIEANFKRVEEAQRCLEEYGKLILPSWGEKYRRLRFQTYTLEKKVKMSFRKKIDFSLYAITGSSQPEEELISKVNQMIKGGVTVLQLREKTLSSKEFLNRALKLRKIIPPRISFIINDRIDIALACGAEGVHLGQDDIPLSIARKIMGESKIIGISTHSFKQAIEAKAEGADYIGIGPVFSTPTKPGVCPVGLEIVSRIKKEIKIPLVAIGGISKENAKKVLETGTDGIAVVTAIFGSKDVFTATENLLKIVRKS